MTENSITFEKEWLKDGNLLTRFLLYTDEPTRILLTLQVENYSKLQKNVIYYTSTKLEDYRWTCKLVIASGTLFVFMSSNINLKKPVASICKVHGDYLMNYNSTIYESLVLAEFCQKAVLDPKNEYLRCGNVVIEFTCDIDLPEDKLCSLESVLVCDQYYENLKHLLFPPQDILIQMRDGSYKGHKAVFSKYSRLFAKIFQNNQPQPNKLSCIGIDEDPIIFRKVLKFLYCGELDCLYEGFMFEIYRIANSLQIDHLMKHCMDYFEANLSPSNEMSILTKATFHNLLDLKNATIRYMRNRGSKMLRSPNFQTILKLALTMDKGKLTKLKNNLYFVSPK